MLITVFLSCEKKTWDSESFLAEDLRSTPKQLAIGNSALVAEAFLWRDFMPVSPPAGSGLISTSQLMTADQTALPSGISLKKQYAVNEDGEVWAGDIEQAWSSFPYEVTGVSRNGPKWEIGSTVHVVCEFGYQGRTYRILAEPQQIKRTD